MPAPRKKPTPTRSPTSRDVARVLASLKALGTRKIREEMFPRYGISGESASKAFGVSMGDLKRVARDLTRGADSSHHHALALLLWKTGIYEARMLAPMIDDPARVTPTQMDRWCRDFDNWGICDTVCFVLFDRVDASLAFAKVKKWGGESANAGKKPVRDNEFVCRGGFALVASLALHNTSAPDAIFEECFDLIERGAGDARNFVKKGVSWALRAIGKQRQSLRPAAIALATRLSRSPGASERWIGKDVLRDLTQ